MNVAITEVVKKFKRKKVLDKISLTLNNGTYGLLGPNGAGKTTLMRCLLGLYRLQGGIITYDGLQLKDNNYITSIIGYLPQKFGLFKELTVYEMLEYMAAIKKIKKGKQKDVIEYSVELVNLSDKLGDRIGELSGGMIRRVGIAQALLSDPQVIIFDEPTAGLDPEERMRFKEVITQIDKNKVILISTHIVEDVEATCDQIIIMNNGKNIFQGDQEQIKNIAFGNVYELKQADEKNIKGKYFKEKSYEKYGEKVIRVLCQEKQNYLQVDSTIEDGYMYAIKEFLK